MSRTIKLFFVSILFLTSAYGVEKERDGGPYIGAGYGMSSYNDGGYFNEVSTKESNSYNLFGGAYINKYLSVELGYIKSGNFDVKDTVTQNRNFNYSAVTVGVLVHYPLWYDNFDIYGKFGAGQSFTSLSSTDGSALVVGAGISYRIDETFAIRTAYDIYKFNYTSDTKGSYSMDLRYAYAGIEVQF